MFLMFLDIQRGMSSFWAADHQQTATAPAGKSHFRTGMRTETLQETELNVCSFDQQPFFRFHQHHSQRKPAWLSIIQTASGAPTILWVSLNAQRRLQWDQKDGTQEVWIKTWNPVCVLVWIFMNQKHVFLCIFTMEWPDWHKFNPSFLFSLNRSLEVSLRPAPIRSFSSIYEEVLNQITESPFSFSLPWKP